MPEARLERTRRSYDRVIDMGPYACKLLDVGNPDHQALNRVWERAVRRPGLDLNEIDFATRLLAPGERFRITKMEG